MLLIVTEGTEWLSLCRNYLAEEPLISLLGPAAHGSQWCGACPAESQVWTPAFPWLLQQLPDLQSPGTRTRTSTSLKDESRCGFVCSD